MNSARELPSCICGRHVQTPARIIVPIIICLFLPINKTDIFFLYCDILFGLADLKIPSAEIDGGPATAGRFLLRTETVRIIRFRGSEKIREFFVKEDRVDRVLRETAPGRSTRCEKREESFGRDL